MFNNKKNRTNVENNKVDYEKCDNSKDPSNLIIWFIILNVIFVIILVGGLIWNHSLLANSQERIINKYDSCVAAISKDTIIQRDKDDIILLKLQDKEESIKGILEQGYNKILSEYESVEIWVGIITVVFLIFSFYSLFKTEQFERVSREATHRISKKADDWDQKEKYYESQLKELKGKLKATLNDTQRKTDELEETFNNSIENATKLMQDETKKLTDNVIHIIEITIQKHGEKLENQEKLLTKLKNDVENKLASLEPISNEDIEKSFDDAIKNDDEEKK